MLFNQPLYSKLDINLAKPAISRIAGYYYSDCMRAVWNDFFNANGVIEIVYYYDLYAFNQFEKANRSVRCAR